VIRLLHGSDRYLIDRAASRLVEETRTGLTLEFNFEDVQADRFGVDAFVEKISTLPFLDSRRVVVLREWNLLTGKRPKSGEVERAAEVVAGVPDTTELILIVHGEVPPTNPIYRVVAVAERDKRARIERFQPPRPSERAGWVRKLAEDRGLTITPAAVRLLLQRVEPDLALIDQEIVKLSLYAFPATRIEETAVAALGSESREDELFALTDALGRGRPGEASAVLQGLLTAGAEPTYLLYLLVQHWRRLLQARAAQDKGIGLSALQARGLDHPFVVEKAYRQAEAHTLEDLERGFHELLRMEELIKLGELDARLAVEGFVLERSLT
jgi:DNA polymerase III subunit delta